MRVILVEDDELLGDGVKKRFKTSRLHRRLGQRWRIRPACNPH